MVLRPQHHPSHHSGNRNLNVVSLIVVFVAVVAVALALIGVAVRGTTPLAVLPAVAVGVWGLATLFK